MRTLSTLPSFILEQSERWETIQRTCQNDRSRQGIRIKEFLYMIDERFRNEKSKSPKYYSSELHTTPSSLRKDCQQVIKVSPSYCIQTRVILEAFKMLKDSNIPIKEIADILGFVDSAYFTRFFTKHVQLSPSIFRNVLLKIIDT